MRRYTGSPVSNDWFDPIEMEVRDRAHEFIEELIRGELHAVLSSVKNSQVIELQD